MAGALVRSFQARALDPEHGSDEDGWCDYGNIHLLSLCGNDLIDEETLQQLGFRIGEDYDQF